MKMEAAQNSPLTHPIMRREGKREKSKSNTHHTNPCFSVLQRKHANQTWQRASAHGTLEWVRYKGRDHASADVVLAPWNLFNGHYICEQPWHIPFCFCFKESAAEMASERFRSTNHDHKHSTYTTALTTRTADRHSLRCSEGRKWH